MTILIILICAFLAALLTFFSGFGLGTLLMPVIAVFFPIALAVAMTAVVHLVNNLFKLFLLRKQVAWPVVFRFGLPAIIAAIPGAWLLSQLTRLPAWYSYHFLHLPAEITPVKVVVGILLICFATIEWLVPFKSILFKTKWLPIGGLLSGFFGGISGQQGAFRAPFLLHVGLTKQGFVSTNAAIAVLVDLARLIVYATTLHQLIALKSDAHLLIFTILAAFAGSIFGMVGLKKMTLPWIQRLVAVLLYCLGALLIAGII